MALSLISYITMDNYFSFLCLSFFSSSMGEMSPISYNKVSKEDNELMHVKYLAHSKDSTLAIFIYIPVKINNCSSLNTPYYLLLLSLSKCWIIYSECPFPNHYVYPISLSRLRPTAGLSTDHFLNLKTDLGIPPQSTPEYSYVFMYSQSTILFLCYIPYWQWVSLRRIKLSTISLVSGTTSAMLLKWMTG